ncbi:MAG: phosphoribosyl transferase [Dehalococcoidales bacterium]|nr:MAG: phosphoribosyl transferase [Dehalococcoidales bacterium]
MRSDREQAIFSNRYDAGRKLAAKLVNYKGKPVVVLAIPNGGLPVALEVALLLEAELDLVISRKLPLPLTPEAGFGAVGDDGTVILNDEVVARIGLSPYQVNYQVNKVKSEIQQRSLLYRENRSVAVVNGKIAIIIDDGLASGYTMMVAVESVRRRRPEKIVVAIPATSEAALRKVREVADEVVTLAIGSATKFYIADFYHYWHDLSNEEAIQCLKEWRLRRFQSNIDRPPEA